MGVQITYPVLISNYDEGIAGSYLKIFSRIGFINAHGSHTHQGILEICETHSPCLIVRDFHYPGMSGERLTEAIRALPSMADVPQILIPERGHDFEKTSPVLIPHDYDLRKMAMRMKIYCLGLEYYEKVPFPVGVEL